jgi:hypothetical protein
LQLTDFGVVVGRGNRNFGLLSFGEEADQDEQLAVQSGMKMKGSYVMKTDAEVCATRVHQMLGMRFVCAHLLYHGRLQPK